MSAGVNNMQQVRDSLAKPYWDCEFVMSLRDYYVWKYYRNIIGEKTPEDHEQKPSFFIINTRGA